MAADKERGPGSASAEIEKYLNILAKDPNSRVFAPLAEAYRKAGLLDDAIETALEGLKVHPTYLGGRVALGRAYFDKRQFAEAAAEMQKVVKSAPDNIVAHKVLGQIAYNQNDLPMAEKAFKMVLLLDPRDQEAQQFVARVGGESPRAPTPAAAPAPTPPSAQPGLVPQVAVALPPVSQSVAPPALSFEPLPIDEIQPLEDLEMQSGDLPGELTPHFPPSQPAGLPADLSTAGFVIEEPLDLGEPVAQLVTPEAVAPPPGEPAQPIATSPAELSPSATSPASDGGLELEVFTRVPWGATQTPTTPTPTPGEVATPEEESPFEVFGRPKRGVPPQSIKGEQVAFGEIDLESAAAEPVQTAAEPVLESPFEMFTRAPGIRAAPVPARAGRGESAGPRELEIETTAFTPSDVSVPEVAEAPLLNLDEELPRIDLTRELEFGPQEEYEPPPSGSTAPPGTEAAPMAEAASQAVTSWGEVEQTVSLDDEIPPLDLAQEMAHDLVGEEIEEIAPAEASPAGEPPGRGVFDTETLATIYVDQGFYGRAAEIYQRLIAQRPDDEELRRKLERVTALERAGIAEERPAAPPPAPATSPEVVAEVAAAQERALEAAGTASPDERINKLQALLEAFKGGRPQ